MVGVVVSRSKHLLILIQVSACKSQMVSNAKPIYSIGEAGGGGGNEVPNAIGGGEDLGGKNEAFGAIGGGEDLGGGNGGHAAAAEGHINKVILTHKQAFIDPHARKEACMEPPPPHLEPVSHMEPPPHDYHMALPPPRL
ncbi:hypothetical protein SELMODRAFT_414130 [Selaginella moellendorffii]|uniref:Uncharacterized protein n=1 Tax=Selaginella moellendorffii TaxID=88036 RepID=D8RRR2_SELML|nr:hypothetical protein SELMODRAFT_414130 [Selaginella moellendorffii]